MLSARSARLVAFAAAFLLVLSGCKARADVNVTVQPNGSGSVVVTAVLDADATAQLGGDVAKVVHLDDLRATGWTVRGPRAVGGTTTISLTKPFADGAALAKVLAQVGGKDGVFRGWKLSRSNSFTVAEYRLDGSVHLTGALDQFSDADVASALDGLAVGRTPEELAAAFKGQPEALELDVTVSLPGEMDAVSGLSTKDPGGSATASRRFVLGDGTATTTSIRMTSSAADRSSVVWILAGVGCVVAALLLLAVAWRRRPRRPLPVDS
ncbi:MAG: hypothetical protein U0Q22_15325 [Acidimicrobiales bacterium]